MNKSVIGVGDALRHRNAINAASNSSDVAVAIRRTLTACTPLVALSGVALSMLSTSQAYADTASAKDDSLEEIVVSGLRRSLQTAQQIKKDAEQVVDSITAQDIGALPDRSVSEALQRIPGITLQRTNENRDPARLASEGGGVFVRGLSWVRSETNGRDIFSANNGRNLSFEDISADLLAGVDVYKNPSAEMIEGGIGGLVNLRTRQPFDSKGQIVAASFDYNYADLLKKGFLSGNALYSNRWNTNAGEFGALVSVSVGNIGNRTDSVQTGRYEPHTVTSTEATSFGLTNGSTVYLPNSLGFRRIDWKQRRESLSASFQWAPSEQLTLTFQALMAQADPKDIEHTMGDDNDAGEIQTLQSGNVYSAQGVITRGTVANAHITNDTRYGESHKVTKDFSLNATWRPGEHWNVSGDIQYVLSHTDVLSLTAFSQLNQTDGVLQYDLRGDDPYMTYFPSNSAGAAQASSYWWAAAMDHLEKNEAHEWAERFDLEYSFDDNPWLKSLRFGVRATDKEAITRETGWNWSLLSSEFWGGGTPVYLNQTTNSAAEAYHYSNFMRGSLNEPTTTWFPSSSLVSNGTANAYNILKATETAGWGWTPLTTDFTKANPGSDNVNGGINNQSEKTFAGYALMRFGHGKFDGNLGARLVSTHVSAIPNISVQIGAFTGSATACNDAKVFTPAIDCTNYNNAYAFSQGGNQSGTETSFSYTDVLPTLNLRYHLTDALQWRLGLGRAMSRPSFSQMQGFSTVAFGFNNFPYNMSPTPPAQPTAPPANDFTYSTGPTATGGNPKLKPTRSDQADMSLEWYFAPAGSVTLAGFYKDITNYIFAGQFREPFVSNGQTFVFDVTRNTNGSHGTVKGFEFAYQQFFDMLPGALSGLGVQANYTLVSSTGGKNTAVNLLESAQQAGAVDQTLPLEGMSKHAFNVALMYEKYGWSGRLAYNWRDRYLLTTSAANIQRPVWSEAYGQLDGSVFYSITNNIKVGLQGTNLLNARTFLDVGGATLAPRYSWTDTDRRIAAAIRVSF